MNDADARAAALEEELAACKARIYDLETALGLHRDDVGLYFRLTEQSTKLLGLLLAVPNVTPEMVQQRLEVATDAKVAISRLRSSLRGHGIEIHNKRSLGYWLDAETKLRIEEMVTPQVTSPSAPALVPVDVDDKREAA